MEVLLSSISDTNLDIQWLLLPQNPCLLIFPSPSLILSLKIEMPEKVR